MISSMSRMLTLLIIIPFSHVYSMTESDSEERWYQVEFVLFEHNEGLRSELRFEAVTYTPRNLRQFQYYFEKPYFDKGYALSSRHLASPDNSELALSSAAARLKRDPRTEVITQAFWQQPIAKESQTLPLKLSLNLSNDRKLDGTVIIRRERYTHFDIDIAVFEERHYSHVEWVSWLFSPFGRPLASLLTALPQSKDDTASDDTMPLPPVTQTVLRLNEQTKPVNSDDGIVELPMNIVSIAMTRRIKDGELHYIDHPAFAVIATITEIPNPVNAELYGENPDNE